MPSEWTIQCSAGDVTTATPFADLSLGNLRISRVSQGIDSASFQAPSADYDGDALFPHGSNVTIRYGATIRFFGICKTIPRQGQPGAESITYRILGPWYWLKRVFETEWKMWDTVAGELQWKQKSRIILGQDRDGNAITTGEQIEEVLAYAIAQGAPLQVGSAAAWPALYVPWTEEVDVKCAEAVIWCLRYSPDCVTWFDYTTSPPTFHLGKRADLDALDLAADASGGEEVESVNITPRYDLQVPGVRLRYEQTHEDGDNTYQTTTDDTAGDTGDIEALLATIELAGSRASYLEQEIVTEDYPDPLADDDWLTAHLPSLGKMLAGDWTIDGVSRTGTLPRILVEGQVQSWMAGVDTEEDTITVTIGRNIRNDDDAIVKRDHQEKVFRVIATDAVTGDDDTRVYRTLGSFEGGEPIPDGLALQLLNAWSELQYDGQYTLSEEECSGDARPGKVLNIVSSSRPEWATMRALIQRTDEDVDQGKTWITFGPAKHLGPDDLVALLRVMRKRNVSWRYNERSSGDISDGNQGHRQDGPVAKNEIDEGRCVVDSITLIDDSGDYEKKITLDPALISKEDADVDIRPREILIIDDTNGVIKTRQVLASAAYGSDQSTLVTVLTGFQYDASTHRLQIKTRQMRVPYAAAESAWVLVTGGQAGNCD